MGTAPYPEIRRPPRPVSWGPLTLNGASLGQGRCIEPAIRNYPEITEITLVMRKPLEAPLGEAHDGYMALVVLGIPNESKMVDSSIYYSFHLGNF